MGGMRIQFFGGVGTRSGFFLRVGSAIGFFFRAGCRFGSSSGLNADPGYLGSDLDPGFSRRFDPCTAFSLGSNAALLERRIRYCVYTIEPNCLFKLYLLQSWAGTGMRYKKNKDKLSMHPN